MKNGALSGAASVSRNTTEIIKLQHDVDTLKLNSYNALTNADSIIPELVLDTLTTCISNEWERFARFLELSEPAIEIIDLDNPNVYEKCRSCITKYKQINGGITWCDLKTILNHMNRNDVIIQLEEKFKVLEQSKLEVQKCERIKRAVSALQQHYIERYSEWIRSNGILDISTKKIDRCSSYVDIAVCSTEHIENTWKIHSDREFHMNQCSMKTSNVKPEDLFKEKYKFIGLSGVAGSGKSTLLVYLTLQWAKNEMWAIDTDGGFHFVFTLLCRELNTQASRMNVEDLLKHQYPFVFEHISFSDLQSYASQVLFIVDGLDEYAHINNLTDASPTSPPGEKCKALHEALNCWEPSLLGHYVIASGRPEASKRLFNCLKSQVQIKRVQVLGFNTDNIGYFIEKYFEDDNIKCDVVKEKIFQSAHLLAMAQLPVYLSILCMLLETETGACVETMSDVFAWSLGLYIRSHYHSKSGNLSNVSMKQLFKLKEIRESLYVVFEIAYSMLSKGKVVFDVDQLQFEVGDSLEYCGLITKVVVGEFDTMLQFTHLSLQEFCAAAHMLKANIDRLFIKNNPLLRGCLPVLSSLEGALIANTKSHPIIKAFVSSLDVKEAPILNIVSIVGLDVFDAEKLVVLLDTADDNVELFLTCLHESQNELPSDVHCLVSTKDIEIEVNDYAHVNLTSLIYFLESLWKMFPRAVKKINFFGTLSTLPHNYFLKFSKFFLYIEKVFVKQRTELLAHCFHPLIHCFESMIAANEPIALKCLHMNACGMLKDRHLKHLSRIMPYVEEFDISYNEYITKPGYEYLAAGVKSTKNLVLTNLNLGCCNLKEEYIEVLKPVFQCLTELNISYNQRISIQGWKCFAAALELNGVIRLRKLDITQCNITDDIMLAMDNIFSNLIQVDFGLNRNITLDGWKCLANSLERNKNINKLDLYACNLSDEALTTLAPIFPKLVELKLCWNRKISHKGWQSMADILNTHQDVVNLILLDLKGCNLTHDDLQVLDGIVPFLDEMKVSFSKQLRWKDLESVTPNIKEKNPWF